MVKSLTCHRGGSGSKPSPSDTWLCPLVRHRHPKLLPGSSVPVSAIYGVCWLSWVKYRGQITRTWQKVEFFFFMLAWCLLCLCANHKIPMRTNSMFSVGVARLETVVTTRPLKTPSLSSHCWRLIVFGSFCMLPRHLKVTVTTLSWFITLLYPKLDRMVKIHFRSRVKLLLCDS